MKINKVSYSNHKVLRDETAAMSNEHHYFTH